MSGIVKAYTRALARLNSAAQKARLDDILSVDPGMATHINEYGMEHLAKTPNPVAVMPADEYLELAARGNPKVDRDGNILMMLDSLRSSQPWASSGKDVADLPDFVKDYVTKNPSASSLDVFRNIGLGMPAGEDMMHGVGADSRGWKNDVDVGGLPLLMWLQRNGQSAWGLGHEGRRRAAFMLAQGRHTPVQMLERTAVVPGDNFISNRDSLLAKAGRVMNSSAPDIDAALQTARQNGEPFFLSPTKTQRSSDEARKFLNQMSEYIPENYFKYGVDRMGRISAAPMPVPWKYPVFAEGGEVAGVEHPNDDTGALTKIADFLRMGPRTPFRIPVVDDIADMLPRFAEGVASEYYGVNQDGDVNLGGYTKGAPLRDRFRPNVAVEVASTPALWGDEGAMEALNDVGRTDEAVRKAFGHSEPKTWSLDNAAYLGGKAAATGVLGSLRALLGRTGTALPRLPAAMGVDLKTLHHITDFFNPAAGRLRDAPIAGAVGAGLSAGIEQAQEHSLQDSEEALDALRERVLNDPAFQNALARGDKDTARMIAQRIMENADAG